MTDRIKRLLACANMREGSFWSRRGLWEEALAQYASEPVPVRRALALQHVLANIDVSISEDDLLAGTHPASEMPPEERKIRQSAPRHDIQVPYRLPEERAALSAGLFTSANKKDHLTVNYPRLLDEGIDRLIARIERAEASCPRSQGVERRAMEIAVHAFSSFIERYADHAETLSAKAPDSIRRKELEAMAEACRHVAHEPPSNLHEALQLTWFTFLATCIENGELNGAFALGRFDHYLHPFWEADIEAGIPRDDLVELVACLWIKLNEFVPRNLASAVLNLTVGGSLADGKDATNDLSVACLESMHELRTVTPSLSVRWHPHIDRTFFRSAVELALEGFGQPAFYGDPAEIKAMINAGVTPEDAVNVVPGGCVELGVQGCCHPWVGNFFNLPKCLELALFNGVDPNSNERLGPETGAAHELDTFDKLFAAFDNQVAHFLQLMAYSDNTTDRLAGEHEPFPLLSCFVDDCIDKGLDIAQGGARYNFTEVQGIGIANVVDSLLNLKTLVYDEAELPLEAILDALRNNFEDRDVLRRRLVTHKPAYGDNVPPTVDMARRVVHTFFNHCEGRTNPRGGTFRPGLLVWTLFTQWADIVGALPDGRRRGEPLVSSIGPRNTTVCDSPTAIIGDATAFDHYRCAGGLTLNLRFDASSCRTSKGIQALVSLCETYFRRGGMQLQINAVDSAFLKEAKASPEEYAGLMVRVSGFCARFNDVSPAMQDEIIARTELASH
ncbi:MAG: hypothetical protein K9N51_03280 [Candidatus Pacebacteria bacterium]|nr:hypothetical protein [Candidatus Paceibacterota bacterium]